MILSESLAIPSGLVLLKKPAGITSFRSLGQLKKVLGTKKIGHTGTLDSFATGLLVILTGKMTKLAPYVEAQQKVYCAVAQLGIETDTLDPEGKRVSEMLAPSLKELEIVIPQFRGEIFQAPPAFSAIKIAGKRASCRVRSGETIEIPKRKVTIYDLQILNYDTTTAQLTFTVTCSKGTYIRSLARDWAKAAGSTAHLLKLERLAVGEFSIEDAVLPEDFLPETDLISGKKMLDLLPFVQQLQIDETHLSQIEDGVPIDYYDFKDQINQGLCALFFEDQFIALIERKDNSFFYRANFGKMKNLEQV